jgi:hypothetical protein
MMETIDLEKVIASAPVWYHGYIRATGGLDLLDQLRDQIETAESLFGKRFFDKVHHRYAPGKWTPCEMLGHLIDAERIFTYRALRFARKDETPLPGFEEDDYVAAANADARSIDSLLEEFASVRQATISLYRSLSEADKWRSGLSNGNPISVYALFYSTVGHFNHHAGVLVERY